MCNPLSDFESWWKQEGQFIPPLDRCPGQASIVAELFASFAKTVIEQCEPELERAYEEGLETGREISERPKPFYFWQGDGI